MKRYACFIILTLALVLAGCVQDPFEEQLSSEGTEISIVVTRAADDATRAALAGGNAVAFRPGDEISIFDGEGNNCRFTQRGEIGTDGSATFTGKVKAVASSYLALYPYMPDVSVAGGRIGTVGDDNVRHPVFIPDNQKAVQDSFDPEAFISVAQSVRQSNSVHSITFRNACALVKFTIPESAGDFTFEKAELKTASGLLAGGVTIAPDGSRNWAGPGNDAIVLTGTMKSGHSYYFCTDARQVNGLSLSLYHYPSDITPVVVKATADTKQVTLARNKVLNLGEIVPAELPSRSQGWYGDGTETNPFQISTKADMSRMLSSNADSSTFRGCHFRLTDDIDAGGDAFVEDGKRVEFCGTFDGNGHTISNYLPSSYTWYNQGSNQYQGIFHRVYRATFKNLTLIPARNVRVDYSNYTDASLFIGKADPANTRTLIENCHIRGALDIAFSVPERSKVLFGGFVGNNGADALDFVNCTNDADITFSEYTHTEYDEEWHAFDYEISDNVNYQIGGYVGHMYCGDKNSTTTFDRCRNSGDISFTLPMTGGGDIHCGGFIGYGNWAFLYASTFSFTNCVNSGNITISVGSGCNSSYGSGFVGFNQIDGYNHCSASSAEDRHLYTPRYYNCLNKGDISVSGNGAHAAGFAFFSKPSGTNNDRTGNENNNQFALCVNIGNISAAGSTACKAAISSGHGLCRWCWWLEADRDHPVLSPTLNGLPSSRSDGPYYCYCYPTINADTPNNRRLGVNGNGGADVVLDNSNTQWTHAQWVANTVEWTGGSRDRSLDLNF